MKKIIISSLILSGCSGNINGKAGDLAPYNRDLISYVDEKRGVICYQARGRAGISCMKMDEQMKRSQDE